jgi:glycosyltransferase 2 family protein
MFSLVTGIAIYALACFPLAWAWQTILVSLHGERRRPDHLLITYARSQLGKYIPGNVAHIAGRHIVASSQGYSNPALVFSTLYEISGLLSAAGLVSSVALLFSGAAILEQFPLIVAVPILAFVLPIFYLVHRLAPRISSIGNVGEPVGNGSAPALLFVPYIHYLLFFLLAGGALVLLTAQTGKTLDTQDYLLVGLAFATSWTLGFLTPGAPSGIGVREAVLVLILSPLVGSAQAIIVSVLFRVVTVGGDLLFWLLMEARGRYRGKALN